ncbi:M23 family metallopeptidase [Caldisericum sp.]|uniref:M23 family metallopeptidase n=1 Tax=Caldisericum sp. TaxID=2499687 RepID=UPI003D121D86
MPEPRLIEADESIGSYPLLNGIQSLGLSTPMRIGNTGAGGDDWVKINCQYNQPRSTTRIHRGVDLASLVNGSVVSRPIFSVDTNQSYGTVYNKNYYGDYGNYILIQHTYSEGSTTYNFQTFFCHLREIPSIPLNTPVFRTTQIGNTGTTGQSTGIHLHMEIRAPYGSNLYFTRRYAPSLLYWRSNGTWGNNTSFINSAGTNVNTVTFRVLDMNLGNSIDVPYGNVKIYYRQKGTTAWFSANMSKSGNNFSYTFSGYPVDTQIEYYIWAKSNSFDGTYYTAYRPYRYSDGTTPTNRPFVHVMKNPYQAPIASEEPKIPGYCYPIVEWDPSTMKEETPTNIDPFVKEVNFTKTVLIEKWVDNYTILAQVATNIDPSGKPTEYGEEIFINTPGIEKGFEKITGGSICIVKGKIISKQPLKIYIPNTEFIRFYDEE